MCHFRCGFRQAVYLEMITPPESQLLTLNLQVYALGNGVSGNRNAVFKVSAMYTSGELDTTFVNEREARVIVSNEWMRFYHDRTRITFLERHEVDMAALIKTERPESPKSDSSQDKSPRSLGASPRYNLFS
jgi:hypothetical protein